MTGTHARLETDDQVRPALFDPSTSSIARMHDYWLGGKDNYAADRAEAERLMAICPRLPLLARQSRLFLARAVQWLAAQGVTQFLDLGCGLPTGQNTHEVAQAVHPPCRVVYVDADPVVITHARARLRGPGVTVIHGDLTDPDAILADLRVQRALNLAEETGDALARDYQAGTLHNHSFRQIAAFVGDLGLIPPGVTDAMAWIPGSLSRPPPPWSGGRVLACIARKPGA